MTETSRLIDAYPFRDLVLEAAAHAAVQGCQRDYQGYLHHCVMGLEAAWQIGEFMPSNRNRLLPFVQMLWYAVGEARAPEIDIKKWIGTPPAEEKLSMEAFVEAVEQRHFEQAYRQLVFLLRLPGMRNRIFLFLFRKALADEAGLAHKLIYLVKTFQFLDAMKWQKYEYLCLPVLHYLMKAEPRTETFERVEAFFNQHRSALSGAKIDQQNNLTTSFYSELKESVFADERDVTLEKMMGWMTDSDSRSMILEGLRLAANELVYESDPQKVIYPLHAFHYAACLSSVFHRLEPEDQMRALGMAALMVKNISALSQPLTKPVIIPLGTIDQKNNPLYFVEHGIEHGDAGRALGALAYILDHEAPSGQLFEALAFLASKNLYSVLYAHDIKLAVACLTSYQQTTHPLRGQYLKTLVKVLAQQPKEHTITNSLVNTQKIKRGYFTVPGSFNF